MMKHLVVVMSFNRWNSNRTRNNNGNPKIRAISLHRRKLELEISRETKSSPMPTKESLFILSISLDMWVFPEESDEPRVSSHKTRSKEAWKAPKSEGLRALPRLVAFLSILYCSIVIFDESSSPMDSIAVCCCLKKTSKARGKESDFSSGRSGVAPRS